MTLCAVELVGIPFAAAFPYAHRLSRRRRNLPKRHWVRGLPQAVPWTSTRPSLVASDLQTFTDTRSNACNHGELRYTSSSGRTLTSSRCRHVDMRQTDSGEFEWGSGRCRPRLRLRGLSSSSLMSLQCYLRVDRAYSSYIMSHIASTLSDTNKMIC